MKETNGDEILSPFSSCLKVLMVLGNGLPIFAKRPVSRDCSNCVGGDWKIAALWRTPSMLLRNHFKSEFRVRCETGDVNVTKSSGFAIRM